MEKPTEEISLVENGAAKNHVSEPSETAYVLDSEQIYVKDLGLDTTALIQIAAEDLEIEGFKHHKINLKLTYCHRWNITHWSNLNIYDLIKNHERLMKGNIEGAILCNNIYDDLDGVSITNWQERQHCLDSYDAFGFDYNSYIEAHAEVLSECNIKNKKIKLYIAGDIKEPFSDDADTVEIPIDIPQADASIIVENQRKYVLWGEYNWKLKLNMNGTTKYYDNEGGKTTGYSDTDSIEEYDISFLIERLKESYQILQKINVSDASTIFRKKIQKGFDVEVEDGVPNLIYSSSKFGFYRNSWSIDDVGKMVIELEKAPNKARVLSQNFDEKGLEIGKNVLENIQFGSSEDVILLEQLAFKYQDVLKTKRNSSVWFDEYDVVQESRWDDEILRFLTTRVFPDSYRLPISLEISKSVIHKVIGEYSKPDISFDDINELTGEEYEQYCSELLEKAGWSSRVTQGSGDQGGDVIASKSGVIIALQCKRYSKPVGNKAVQEIFAALSHYGAETGYVVTNNTFTPAARKLASSTGIKLIHHEQLETL